MKLFIKPSEHLSFNWVKFGPSPSWSWFHSSGQEFHGEPLEGSAGNASIGAAGATIPGKCVAVSFNDMLYDFTAQEL